MAKGNNMVGAGIGPSKILLLNCGKFDFAEVELDAPLHLIGPNNVGKTSLIALLQLLYIDDQRQMHFSRDLSETKRYYFPDIYSYALFECLTPTGFQVVGVHGLGPVKQYEFERFAYIGRLTAADYLDGTRCIRPHEEIFRDLATRHFTRLVPRQLRAALTGVGDNRGVDLRLVPARHSGTYDRFRKVFNNILRLSHLKQDELKNLILDIFGGEFQQRSIDLAETYAQGFEKVQRDSREVDDLKQLQGDIEALLKHIEQRDACRCALPSLWQAVGRALTEAGATLDREEAEHKEGLTSDETRGREIEAHIETISRTLRDMAARLGILNADLERIEQERRRFADFVPDWAEQRQRDVRVSIDKLAFRLGQSAQTPEAQIQGRLQKLERDIAQRRHRLQGLAKAAVQWLRGRFTDDDLNDLFRVLNTELLEVPIRGEAAGGKLHDEAAVETMLSGLLAWRKERTLHAPGLDLSLDGLHAPGLERYLDPAVIQGELDELETQQKEYQEALSAARDATRIRKEKQALEAEWETLVRDLGDYRKFGEFKAHEDVWRSERDALEQREAENDAERTRAGEERVEIARRIERIREELSRVEDRRRNLAGLAKDLRQPPAEWPLVPGEEWPAALEELVPRYRRLYSDQLNQQEHVVEILGRIEARTYSRYVAADEQTTVQALREQLDSIPEKEKAVQQLWTSIAVGIKKALSNIAHDLDTLKGLVQRLNQQIGSVAISNLTSLRILVQDRHDWVRHIRGIGLDEDMPLFADAKAVRQSFDDLGRLLSEHPRVDLDDLFDLQFEVGTSDDKVRRHAHLNAIESNGTTITIKVLVNLVLLRGLLEDARVRIPFYLDECSSLDHDNLAAIVNAARSMGFIAVLASPDAMDAAERLYFIEEGENGRVVLDPASTLVRIVRDEDGPDA